MWGIPGRGRIQELGPWGGTILGCWREMKGQYGWSLVNNIGWGHMVKSLIGPSKELNCGASVAGGHWEDFVVATVLSNWFLWRDFPGGQWIRTTCQGRDVGSIPGPGRCHRPWSHWSPCVPQPKRCPRCFYTFRNHSFILQIFTEYPPPARRFLYMGDAV